MPNPAYPAVCVTLIAGLEKRVIQASPVKFEFQNRYAQTGKSYKFGCALDSDEFLISSAICLGFPSLMKSYPRLLVIENS